MREGLDTDLGPMGGGRAKSAEVRLFSFALLTTALVAHASVGGAAPTARFDDAAPPTAAEPVRRAEPERPPQPKARTAETPSPSESWATRAARELVARAARASARGARGDALTLLNDALRMDPTYGPAYVELGKLREALGDPLEAERVYGVATRFSRGRAEAHAARAALRHRAGRTQDALSDLEAAVALRDGDLALVELLLRWYVETRAWPAALATARRSVALLERQGPERDGALAQARLQVRALAILAAETDPVQQPSTTWVRRALASIARR